MSGHAQSKFGLLVSFALLLFQTQGVELPVSYQIPSPLIASDEEWVVSVYQDADLTIGRQHRTDKESFIRQAQQGNPNWTGAYTYLTSDRTDGDLAKYQRLGRPIWDIRTAEPIQEGKWYRNRNFDEIKFSVKNLSVNLERGSEDRKIQGLQAKHYICRVTYDFTKIDEDRGDHTEKEVQSRRDFWFAPSMPFSRVQMIPLIENNHDFVNYAEPRIQEGIYAQLRSKFEQLGMLMKTRLQYGGDPLELGIESLNPHSEPIDTSGITAIPAIPESQVSLAMGPLFLAEMLHGSVPEGGNATLQFEGDQWNPALDIDAGAGFRVMGNGDFSIAATFQTEEGVKGIFALLRPIHGRPETGTYGVTRKWTGDQLKALDQDELRDYAEDFQIFALVDRGESLKVYTQAMGGSVELTESSESQLKGRFDLDMETLTIVGKGEDQTQKLKGEFQAVKGLKGRLRSRVGRLIE